MYRFLLFVSPAVLLLLPGSTSFGQQEENQTEAPGTKAHIAAKSPIEISKETTYITEPVDEQGYVDYLKAINQRQSAGVTVENNAAVAFVKSIGVEPLELESESLEREFFEKLGIESPSRKGEYFRNFQQWIDTEFASSSAEEREAKAERLENALYEGIGVDDKKSIEVVTAYTTANSEQLDALAEGLKLPHFYMPLVTAGKPPVLMASFSGKFYARELVRAYSLRSQIALLGGDIEAAWEDIRSIYRLSRHLSKGGTLIEGLVAIAIESIGHDAAIRLIQTHSLSATQLVRVQKDLAALSHTVSTAERLEAGERFFMLDAYQSIVRKPEIAKELDFSGPIAELLAGTVDHNECMRVLNKWADKSVAAAKSKTRAELDKAQNEIETAIAILQKRQKSWSTAVSVLLSAKARGKQIGEVFVALMLPATNMAVLTEKQSESKLDLLNIAIALEQYKLAHKKYPEKLTALAPKYLKEVPTDWLANDKPYSYSVAEGEYRLVGVGRDGLTDGAEEDEIEGDDIVVSSHVE
jgi:hypothetical protein